MKITTFLAIGTAALALSACAPRYYGDERYVTDRYYQPRGPVEYTDRDRAGDHAYANDSDEVLRHDRDYREHY